MNLMDFVVWEIVAKYFMLIHSYMDLSAQEHESEEINIIY